MRMQNLSLLLVLVGLVSLSLWWPARQGADGFAGTDGQATEEIARLRPEYEPWIQPLWQPPGAEVESLLFAVQAALGAGLLGYFLGVMRERNKDAES
ncbi:MAG: energy-coupling factor ABC transporter substrate-binding protein [Candidatus Handelsmanbacteria bacterium]|nr:energy-coupling factor ABC transporter substrate-binding protein [Candidatus Handelsmanbacteria bacterium]